MKYQSFPHNLAPIPDQTVYNRPIHPAPSPPGFKRTKSERLLDTLVCYLTNPQVNGRKISLHKNIMGTRYVIWDFKVIFLGEDKFLEYIKSDAYFQIFENMSDAIIKSALQIVSGQHSLWICDESQNRITPIRSISLYSGHFAYFFDSKYFVTNDNNKFINGCYFPKGIKKIQYPEDPNFLNEVDDSSNHSLIKGMNIIMKLLFPKLNISEDYFLIILTWLVQSMASNNYTLLELIGESKSGKSCIQSFLRELIDPNLELITQAPKKIKELEKQTMNGHVMSFDDVEKLDDDIQLFMVDLMSLKGAKITYPLENKEYSGDIFVRRPIILNSVIPVVTHEKLQSKTLTIELKAPKYEWHDYFEQSLLFIPTTRLYLLKLAKAIFNLNSNESFPRCIYKDLYHFSEIGLRISQIIYSTTDVFEKQLNLLIKEQFLAKLEENLTSYLLFIWAKENANTQKEMSPANWIKKLEIYHDNSFGEWKITPKQFGSDLKKFAPVLRDFGINCESLGKRGSFVRWKITTAEKIDLQANFFDRPA